MDGNISMPGALPSRHEVGLLVLYVPTGDMSIHAVRLTAAGEPALISPVGNPHRPFADGGSVVLRAGATHTVSPEAYRPDNDRMAALIAQTIALAEAQEWRVIRVNEAVGLLAGEGHQLVDGHGPVLRVTDTGERIWHPLHLRPVRDGEPTWFSQAAFVFRPVTP